MNRIQEIRIGHHHPFKYTHVEILRQTTDAEYRRLSRFSLSRLEEVISALMDQGEGRMTLQLYTNSVEVIYILPSDYVNGRVELSKLLR